MLESRVLLLRPPDAGGVRPIADAAGGAPLGFARRRREEPAWWELWRGTVLAVHEQEEEPLLFTVRRRSLLFTRHEVLDAEGERVGYVQGPLVKDRHDEPFARLRQEGAELAFERGGGARLAGLVRTPDGLRLAFTEVVAGNPFAKMLLLAAALLLE